MARPGDHIPQREYGSVTMAARGKRTQTRRVTRLQDEVYREMFRLEGGLPGAEMGLALALLRAWVAVERLPEDDREWLRTISPIGLRMIEESLERLSAAPEQLWNRRNPDRVP
jgi:hypothetical protein